jgi:hypothetical protein
MRQDSDARPRVVRHAKGKRPKFSDVGGVDELMSMVLVLASELCVLRDRVDAMERVGARNGIDFAAEIEQLPLDQAALEAREARRQDLFQRLYYLARKEAEELKSQETTDRYKAIIDEIAKP